MISAVCYSNAIVPICARRENISWRVFCYAGALGRLRPIEKSQPMPCDVLDTNAARLEGKQVMLRPPVPSPIRAARPSDHAAQIPSRTLLRAR